MSRAGEAGAETSLVTHLRDAAEEELFGDIVPFWCEKAVDHQYGGFVGRMTNDLRIVPEAPKGLVLNTRILWAFSALHAAQPDSTFRQLAERALSYFVDFFLDRRFGGAYWMLDHRGQVLDDAKKIYGQAFAIYALSEYAAAFHEGEALRLALEIFELVERHNLDKTHGGYFEAANRDWSPAVDMRLSERDLNERKSTNTHLHLLEAYANLYRVSRAAEVRDALRKLLLCFLERIYDPRTRHWIPFFNDEWQPRSRVVSFGHEIEGSWLLCEAARLLDDGDLQKQVRQMALNLAEAVLTEGFAEDAGIYHERREDGQVVASLQWWQQAEAVVGFINAYQLSGESRYLEAATRSWEFIERHLLDRQYGEWFYELLPDRRPNPEMYKICEWKGPYHNSRMCLELMTRTVEIAKP